MSVEVSPRNALRGWTPIIGAFSIWFAHFFVVYGAALVWPDQMTANVVGIIATVPALIALGVLFVRMRSTEATSHHTEFTKRFGLGSIFIATAGTLFDAMPALFA